MTEWGNEKKQVKLDEKSERQEISRPVMNPLAYLRTEFAL